MGAVLTVSVGVVSTVVAVAVAVTVVKEGITNPYVDNLKGCP